MALLADDNLFHQLPACFQPFSISQTMLGSQGAVGFCVRAQPSCEGSEAPSWKRPCTPTSPVTAGVEPSWRLSVSRACRSRLGFPLLLGVVVPGRA